MLAVSLFTSSFRLVLLLSTVSAWACVFAQMAPGVCSEWQRLSHLRGACLTVGFADTVRVLANSAAQAKAAWSEAAASLDDMLLDHSHNEDGDTDDKSEEVI